MDVSEKKAEAKRHRGVSYDARVDRFGAEISVGGVRRWLGSYSTAQEAADAYLAAKPAPSRTDGLTKAGAALQELLDTMPVDAKGRPVIEEFAELRIGDQVYTYWGKEFRRAGGRVIPIYQWATECATCGAPFDFYAPASSKALRAMRTQCDDHKRAPSRSSTAQLATRRLRGGAEVTPELLARLAAEAEAQDLL